MYIIAFVAQLQLVKTGKTVPVAKASDTQAVGHWFEPRPDN